MSKSAPKVFISYSHDSDDHKRWVLNLATQLRMKGIDAVLDQWDLRPGKDVTLFMEEQLSACDYSILICTDRYVEKSNKGEGGVGYERMIVSSELIKNIDAGKFIPVIRNNTQRSVPKFIQTKLYLDFNTDEFFHSVLDDLIRTIFNAEVSTKPALGEVPSFYSKSKIDDSYTARSHSGLSVETYEIFETMIKRYDDDGFNEWSESRLQYLTEFGRVTITSALYDLQIKEYIKRTTVQFNHEPIYKLTTFGINYAKKINIV